MRSVEWLEGRREREEGRLIHGMRGREGEEREERGEK